jgi:peroxiredoxin
MSAVIVGCNKPVDSATSKSTDKKPSDTTAPLKPNGDGGDNDKPGNGGGTSGDEPQTNGAGDTKPGDFEAASEMPKMEFSDAHDRSNLLKPGNPMPDFELADLNGKQQKLSDLHGEKLTVVFFWTAEGDRGRAGEQMEDLQIDFADQYGEHGVAIVGINQKQSAEEIKAVIEPAQVTFVTLLDESGGALSQIAADFLPRTYLLDAEGNVVWLDIGYSRDTKRGLDQAIRYKLAMPTE